jgi:hypothetical protein
MPEEQVTVWVVPSRPGHYHSRRDCYQINEATHVIAAPWSETEDRDRCRACIGVSETRPPTVKDREIIEGIEAAIRERDTALNGEPGYDDLVNHVDMPRSTLKDRVQALVSDGTLARSKSTRLHTGGEIATFRLATDANLDRLEVPADD